MRVPVTHDTVQYMYANVCLFNCLIEDVADKTDSCILTGLFLLDPEPTLGGGVAGVHGRPRS